MGKAKGVWYQKFVGCSFTINGCEVVFEGTFENTETKSGLPLQYVFHGPDLPNYVTDYKEARAVMGAMVDKYRHK